MKVEIKGLDSGTSVDVQERLKNKWVSKGVEVLRRGQILKVESKGEVRIFLEGEKK